MRRAFSECICDFLERDHYVPGYGDQPSPKIIQKNVGMIELNNGVHIFIKSIDNIHAARGMTINRAYLPLLAKHQAKIKNIMQTLAPLMTMHGSVVRY